MIIEEAFEVHEQLNPAIWDGNQLKPEVYDKIMAIVEEFRQQVQIAFNPIDILIVGSNASFNYTDKSDLDTHIVVNFDSYDSSKQILTAYYNLEKTQFNKNYDISIHGVDVELYIEDARTTAVSNGVYSVLYKKWIKYPKPIDVPVFDISDLVNKWENKINSLLVNGSKEELQKAVDDLYVIRTQSIAADGEYSKGNYLFKQLRDLGLIDSLKDAIKEKTSQILTLEQLELLSIGDLLRKDI